MKNKTIKPQKSLGQNFLIDKNIAEKIVRLSGIDKTSGVLEIGPGLGALTMPLADAAGHVTAIELDSKLAKELEKILADYKNITIIHGDVLKLDINKIIKEHLHAELLHVCANLPYNITTPVITKLIETGGFNFITIMIQKEVAQRICAKPGTPEYGAFTVFVNYYTTPEILFDVPPECFNPRPKVTSSVIRMKVKDTQQLQKEHKISGEDEKLFFKVVKAAFSQRRKTLVNALYATFESTHNKEEIAKIIECCGFDVKIRGERLGIEEFKKITSKLY